MEETETTDCMEGKGKGGDKGLTGGLKMSVKPVSGKAAVFDEEAREGSAITVLVGAAPVLLLVGKSEEGSRTGHALGPSRLEELVAGGGAMPDDDSVTAIVGRADGIRGNEWNTAVFEDFMGRGSSAIAVGLGSVSCTTEGAEDDDDKKCKEGLTAFCSLVEARPRPEPLKSLKACAAWSTCIPLSTTVFESRMASATGDRLLPRAAAAAAQGPIRLIVFTVSCKWCT